MAKNIIVCSDGTGNTAIKDRGTNVFKLFEAADLNGHLTDPTLTPQIAIYGDGVGTESFKPLQILGLATGLGLARNVRQLYREVCRNYDDGDKVFLFGFSRGAFTVRTLAGMIHHCGILSVSPERIPSSAAFDKKVADAYRAYRKSYRTELMKKILGNPGRSAAERFRKENCLDGNVPIEFIGVWDTVDSVGTPFRISDIVNYAVYRYKFPDNKLNESVKRACHALAIDEARDAFTPEVWNHDERIEQVWFAGVHSNVGGGYPKQGMSLVTLEWMFARASEAGLRLVALDRQICLDHSSVLDHLYNSRAGAGVFYRWLPRDMQAICNQAGIEPKIHVSVLERVAHGTDGYAPGTLSPNASVAITELERNPDGAPNPNYPAARARADRVQTVFQDAYKDRKDKGKASLLNDVRSAIWLGRRAYNVFLLSCASVVFAAAVPQTATNPQPYLNRLGTLLWSVAALRWDKIVDAVRLLVINPTLSVPIAAGFALAAILYWTVLARLRSVFSQFWYKYAPKLRDQLKQAHLAAAAGSSK